jgi:crotonobetainyl-CoA:carnitine CoA-transferase CaiB-like acyl-CoA transferase
MAGALPGTFTDPRARREHAVALDETIASWSAGWDRDDLVAALDAAGVPAAPVLGPEEVVHDEQLSHRAFFGWLDAGVDGTVPVPQLAVLRGSDRLPATRAGAPGLDEQGPQLRAQALSSATVRHASG